MARAWQRFGGARLLVLSGNDHTAMEFIGHAQTAPAWHGALAGPHLQRCDLRAADHTFSDPADAREVEARTIDWLRSGLGWGGR
jgi:uncharacterized protein